jgi:SNF2 family DNA or RNA helicase
LGATARRAAAAVIEPPQPHQQSAIERIMDEESLLIEYGTGTGKTRIATEVATVLLANGEIPGLVIVPNSIIDQTVEEFTKWTGERWVDRYVHALDGSLSIYQRREALKRGRAHIYIISTESLSYGLIREGVASREWGWVIIDEASRYRNYSKRTVTLQMIGKRAASRYALTGNLMVRAPTDVWYITNWLRPGIWGTRDLKIFKATYCIMGGYSGTAAIGIRPDKKDEFLEIMNSLRIQCELSDIRDMPERTLEVRKVGFGVTQRAAYEQMREELLVEIENTDEESFRSEASTYAVRLLRLQEICAGFSRNVDGEVARLASPKTEELLDLLEDSPTTPTVIWYWWRPELDTIRAGLARHGFAYSVFGEKGAVDRFMRGEVDIIVSQLQKGGFGLNLTRATRMIYHSLPWDLDVYSQSQERNMRLTTTADHLEIVHLVVRGSVDEYVRGRLLEKADVSATLSRSQALAILRGKVGR